MSKRILAFVLLGAIPAIAALVLVTGTISRTSSADASVAAAPKTSTLQFHDDMRVLWEEHLNWTRLTIVSLANDLPDSNTTVARLLQNQTDIGDAFRPYYGDEAADELTELLTTHIVIAAEIIEAAKAGDTAAFNDAVERWYENGDEIATFWNGLSPKNWPLDEMKTMFRAHLDITLEEAATYLAGDFEASVNAYEEAHAQILGMADMLSGGIERQFPRAFTGPKLP